MTSPLRHSLGFRTPEERWRYVQRLFDLTAGSYDSIERMASLGTSAAYRRRALRRAGLRPGMKVLDVAAGTGLLARQSIAIAGSPRNVVALDPSPGMLAVASRELALPVVLGRAEHLAVRDGTFDFLTLGYALRHLDDLVPTFRELLRVLRPGGTVCVMEITPPRSRAGRAGVRLAMKHVVPGLGWLTTGRKDVWVLWRFFWETIEACVPPDAVLAALAEAGFTRVRRNGELKVFSEFVGEKPG